MRHVQGHEIEHHHHKDVDEDRAQGMHRAHPVAARALDIKLLEQADAPAPISIAFSAPISTGRPTAAVVTAPRQPKMTMVIRTAASLPRVVALMTGPHLLPIRA
jgi:hypothetical protein